MARCENCGNVVPDGQAACPICGAPISSGNNNGYRNGGNTNSQYTNQAYQNQSYYNQANNTYQNNGYQNSGYQNNTYQNNAYQNNGYQNNTNSMDGQDFTYMYDPRDIQQNKGMAILSYFGLLCLIPLLSNHTSRYARFHTVQGFNLFLLEIAISILTGVSFGIGVSFVVRGLYKIVHLGIVVLTIVGIVNAANGKAKELPIIGKIHILNLY